MEEVYLTLDVIKNNPGFSIDIGCSVGKLVYRPKSLYKNGQIISEDKIRKKKFGPLYLRLFERGDIDSLVKIIQEECDLTVKPRQQVHVAGLGSSAAKQRLEEAFNININIKVEPEYDTGVDAISFIYYNLGPEEIFLPEPPGAREEAVRRFKLFQGWIKGGQGLSRVKWQMEQDEEESLSWQPDSKSELFPYLLVICGSLFPMTKVDINGSLTNINSIFYGGRFIMGLLATITGERDFDKLIKMAEESDGRTTNLYGSDLMKMDQKPDPELERRQKEDETDIYNVMKGDLLVFPFGKPATSEGEVKKGDMVHSILETAIINLALTVQMTALANGCKKVLFAGNFMSASLLREWLGREMIKKNLESPKENRLEFHFIRHGGHISNIGAYLAGARSLLKGPR